MLCILSPIDIVLTASDIVVRYQGVNIMYIVPNKEQASIMYMIIYTVRKTE